ncbi:hypothetical protein Tco_0975193 [Tanacetum coccineum]|uniref:Uncharacterized protein n=1 Tax=Tanacetum coccineum TaxID=301880 RepID=A0ABQ5EDP6_9ASTR
MARLITLDRNSSVGLPSNYFGLERSLVGIVGFLQVHVDAFADLCPAGGIHRCASLSFRNILVGGFSVFYERDSGDFVNCCSSPGASKLSMLGHCQHIKVISSGLQLQELAWKDIVYSRQQWKIAIMIRNTTVNFLGLHYFTEVLQGNGKNLELEVV